MAVHLNARLHTRFIPFLFSAAVLVSLAASVLHASDEVKEELRSLVEESEESTQPPSSLDRRPGLSPITYAPEASSGARAAIAAQLEGQNGEEPAPMGADSSVDQISVQPTEADYDQR